MNECYNIVVVVKGGDCCCMNECYNIVVVVKVVTATAIEGSFSAWGGLGKPNLGLDPGETFFPDSGSDLDSDETFQI